MHRLAALAEPVDVDDGYEVVELAVGRVLEGLPHRALGHLAVAAERPDAVGDPVESLPRQGDADRDGQPLPQRAGRHVDPGKDRSRVPLEPAAELAECQELLVVDRSDRLVDGVEERRSVPLREDQVVVRWVLGVVEVVAEVLVDQDGHEVGGRHRGRRVPRLRHRGGANRIDPQLLPELAPALRVAHTGHPNLSVPRFPEVHTCVRPYGRGGRDRIQPAQGVRRRRPLRRRVFQAGASGPVWRSPGPTAPARRRSCGCSPARRRSRAASSSSRRARASPCTTSVRLSRGI